MKRAATIIVWTLALIPFGLAAYFVPRLGKSYHFPEVTIDATVNPDGSLTLHERRTFEFRGDFTFAFFNISPVHAPPSFIEGFTITEDGQPVPFDTYLADNGGFEARWDYQASDERRTWDIAYTVHCAVDVYTDAAHLNWQFIGTGWDVRTDHALITVHVPGRAKRERPRPPGCAPSLEPPMAPKQVPLAEGDVLAWGHGPLAGEVRIPDAQTVALEIRDLEPATFVEGSILMPADVVPVMSLTPGGAGRDRIIAEEQRLADQANALRAAHRRETSVVKVLFVIVPLLMLGLFLWSRRRDRVPGVPPILQEPPRDTHPAVLALVWNAYRKRLGAPDAYRAQFMHLVQEKAIEIEAIGRVTDPEEVFVRAGSAPTETPDSEFLAFLLPGDEQRPSLRSIKAKGARKTLLGDWWEALAKKAKPHVKKISEGRARLETMTMAGLGIAAAVYGFWRWTGFSEDFESAGLVGLLAAWLIPVGIGSWMLFSRLARPALPPKLKSNLAEWAAFRRFLREFSSLEEAPTLAVIVWERYLVYAVALGVADRVEKQVRALVPEDRLAELAPDNVPGSDPYWHHHVTHSPAYAAASPASAVGYSSGWGSTSGGGGGGGGFSGGGGGGGGGTGGGAG